MVYEISCTFTVRKLGCEIEAKEFGTALCEHIVDTFNDDGSIDSLVAVSVKKKGKGA